MAKALHGQYAVERELGRGGMGVVFLARDLVLDRAVAMKVLPQHMAAQGDMRERFLREARTAAKLGHPNVVPVYRAAEIDGAAFFTMAFIEGESLADRIRDRGPLASTDAIRIFKEVAWALAYAHARGVVHRDIKPENILLDRHTGRALVGDFGIARQADASRITQDGLVLGTFHYMSPEQVSGEELDGRSDIYSLGIVMYQSLSGRLPFEGLTAPAVLMAHASRQPPPLQSVAPDLPAGIATIVDRCMAKRPEDRFGSCEAVADALEGAVETAPRLVESWPDGVPPVVNEAQASAIWKRAAQLQADALHRLEQRQNLIARDAIAPSVPSDGYKLADVAAAAEEVGISRQYVAMALAEIPRGGLIDAVVTNDMDERIATRYLGTRERSIAVSVTIPATPPRALRALGAALRLPPYSLSLRETVGAHPLDGGVMIFDLPARGAGNPATGQSWVMNAYWVGLQMQLEARQVQITLRQSPGDPSRTEATMTADLRPGVRRNILASKWIAGVLGGLTTAGVTGVVAKITAAAVLGTAGVGGLATGGAIALGSFGWYRWLYRGVIDKARGEMLRALESIASTLREEEVFGTIESRTPLPPSATTKY